MPNESSYFVEYDEITSESDYSKRISFFLLYFVFFFFFPFLQFIFPFIFLFFYFYFLNDYFSITIRLWYVHTQIGISNTCFKVCAQLCEYLRAYNFCVVLISFAYFKISKRTYMNFYTQASPLEASIYYYITYFKTRSHLYFAENEAHVIKSDLFTILQDRFIYFLYKSFNRKNVCELLKKSSHHIKTLLLTLDASQYYIFNRNTSFLSRQISLTVIHRCAV